MNDAILRTGGVVLADAVETTGGESDRWTILCDFDGTISLSDVTDTLLTRFGMPGYEELETAWADGKIGSRECMEGQIALLDASKEELDAALDTIQLDPAFVTFVALATQLGMPVKVVSDGLDYAIARMLRANGLGGLPIYANRLIQAGERRWKLEFPYANKDCAKASGNCKCMLVGDYQGMSGKVLFVGDGGSDFCASGRADFVLAKLKLIGYCRQEDIAHLAISGFDQAVQYLHANHVPAAAAGF